MSMMFRTIGPFEWYPGRGSEGDEVTGVVIGQGQDPTYARGFLEAAQHLAAEVARPGLSSYHGLAIPALYCFRHALELMLKSLIRQVDEVLTACPVPDNEPAPPPAEAQLLGSHSLIALEANLTEKLRHHGYDFLTSMHRATIKRVHDIDPGGVSLRYGLNKKGDLLLQVGWEVEIREVDSSVTAVFEQLDLIWWYLTGFASSNPTDSHQMWSY